jgi:hypothetical protein
MAKNVAPVKKQDAIVKNNAMMELPEHLRGPSNQRLGSENVEQNDIVIPSLKLAQDTTDEARERHEKHIEGLKPGMYFNTVTKEVYGESITVIPIHFYKTRVRWNKKEMGSGVRCSSKNALVGIGDPGGDCLVCPCAARTFEETDSERKCQLGMNFPLFVLQEGVQINLSSICVYQMKSIACDTAKRWNSLDNMRGKNRFDGTYTLGVRYDQRDSGNSFQPTIENLSWSTAQQSAIGKEAYESIVRWLKDSRVQSSEDVDHGTETEVV